MNETPKHRLLNSALFTVLVVPLGFFLLRDLLAVFTGLIFEMTCGKESLLYRINDDVARLAITALMLIVMPLFFRGKCCFGFRGGYAVRGILLALPQLIVVIWNLLQIKVYAAPLVSGTAAVIAAVFHGIGPGVSEEVFCRGFAISNLMRLWKDKPNRVLRCMLASGAAFGLLHLANVIVTGDIFAALIQVVYTAAIGMLDGAIYLRSRNLLGVILMHTLTDVSAVIAKFETNATYMDILFTVFGSILFVALALFLIRPAKQAEIHALWADNWSFGDEDGKKRTGAKLVAIISATLALLFAATLGTMVYRVQMGYDFPFLASQGKELDKNIRYAINGDSRQLMLSFPGVVGGTYELENSNPEAFVLLESKENGDTYQFVFLHEGNDHNKVTLKFSLKLGNEAVTMTGYSVSVIFYEDGRISAVGG